MMMMMIESTMAVRFPGSPSFCSSSAVSHYRSISTSEEASGVHVTSRRLAHSGCFNTPRNRFQRLNGNSFMRRTSRIRNRTRVSAEHLGSASDPGKQNGRPWYHPFEDISKSASENSGDARLTDAETARTVIEVNGKATMMFTDLINDEVHDNVIWSEVPYLTDEHGNIYFQVKHEEDILRSLTSENNFVQVIIGLDTTEMIKEMELPGPSEIDFGIEEVEGEDSDVEDDEEDEEEEDDSYDDEWVDVLEDVDDDEDEDETLGDWANLDTMRSSHPMYFAKKLAEVALDDPVDWMEEPPAGLAIQGFLSPALIEEQSDIQKHLSSNQSHDADIDQVWKAVENEPENLHIVSGHRHGSESSKDNSISEEESKKVDMPMKGTSFYKLEMIKIQLILADGYQAIVEVEDVRKAQPDAIVHSAAKIISHLKAGGEKTTQALKSLCWISKGIQVEATSEYSAERQLNDLLFPRINSKPQQQKQTDIRK
ncbi:uncharacterized protein At3g49140-like isoform X2 [Mangifera indica]|uniref:uncharacterized protein At3g49140-like isoform X2 n=1 Tax=Mangifera indica TaxID=29780 RepID=UPI001CFC361C|nr:uncharacterized protein At3g49140-like isoform X2 [Mangifera indica]